MDNILTAKPMLTPHAALRYSADQLLTAAEAAGKATQDELHSYIDESEKRTIKLTRELSDAIEGRINKVQGRLKGPAQNATDQIDIWGGYAIRLYYRLGDEQVQKAFAQFLLSLVTAGFINEDNTGTQMGNYTHGEWRGGGYHR